jgi:hypothetical protein
MQAHPNRSHRFRWILVAVVSDCEVIGALQRRQPLGGADHRHRGPRLAGRARQRQKSLNLVGASSV